MSFLSKIFGKKEKTQMRIGGMEDFMNLIGVYQESLLAVQLGISNLSMLRHLRIFKQTLKVATVNNRLGVGERAKCRKMLIDIYDMSEDFFKEIDQSVKHNCKKIQDVNSYSAMFGAFSQDLMMMLTNQMQLKLRLPSFFHKMLLASTTKTISDIMTINSWKDESARRTAANIRIYAQKLGFSEKWMCEYAYKLISLAKKEPMPADTNTY